MILLHFQVTLIPQQPESNDEYQAKPNRYFFATLNRDRPYMRLLALPYPVTSRKIETASESPNKNFQQFTYEGRIAGIRDARRDRDGDDGDCDRGRRIIANLLNHQSPIPSFLHS